MEYPLFLESMIPTTASVFVADISVSERRKGVRHQLCWLWWPVTAKLMIAACLYSFYTFHSTGNTEPSSTYRRPTWEPRLLARRIVVSLLRSSGTTPYTRPFRVRLAHGQPATDAITSLAIHVIGGIGLRESSRLRSQI